MFFQDEPVSSLPFVGPAYAKRLEKLEIKTVGDLFHHIPRRFLDFSKTSEIKKLQIGEIATVKGVVTSFINQYTKSGRMIQIVNIEDSTGTLSAIWFNQPFLRSSFKKGSTVAFGGTLGWFGRNKAFMAPEYEVIRENTRQIHTGGLIPIYPETAGISSKWLRRRVSDALERYTQSLSEFLSKDVISKNNLLDYTKAINNVHTPKSIKEYEKGKERLSFNEFFFLIIQNIKRKRRWQKNRASNELTLNQKEVDQFVKTLPFKLTDSQKNATEEILSDLEGKIPMNRILEGDVGSGKTVVAAIGVFATFLNGYQTVIMAPTQILATQHYRTLIKLFEKYKITINLITSDTRLQSPQATASGGQVFIGTHALLSKNLNLDNVAFIVIDEQHRFGVTQREALVKKTKKGNIAPHVLTMTATPIPRTVALTFFGDLDISILNELPSGRKKITTWIVPQEKRNAGYQWLHKKIKEEETQVFVVCPLIDESEKETMIEVKAVTKEAENLKKLFPDLKIGLIHGKLSAKEKDRIIDEFKEKKTDILVATPVIEVGIDIPNATIMVIEAADRFGLAQLHQLRGRVGRGEKKSYCILLTESKSEISNKRLSYMEKSYSGFELAEADFKLRGPGEIFGTSQSGFPTLKIATWDQMDLLKSAKEAAEKYYPQILKKPEFDLKH
ncbi:MAG: ATP-dependent DNA helicase RecG [Patescibacteria group bacterium]